MDFKMSAEPQLHKATTLGTTFQQFFDSDWTPHKKRFQQFLDEEWSPVKRQFEDILQWDMDSAQDPSKDVHDIQSSPELTKSSDDDVPPAKSTRKRAGTERSDPPTPPAAKRRSSGSASRRRWVELEPVTTETASDAWHADLLDALLAEWTISQMLRSQQWVLVHGTEEMQATLDSLSTGCVGSGQEWTRRSSIRTFLRGACVPPLIVSANPPKPKASSSLNDLRRARP